MERLKSTIIGFLRRMDEQWYNRYQSGFKNNLTFSQAIAAYPDPNKLYAYMHYYFRHSCPEFIRKHRNYFKKDQRSFGENAFHAAWWLLLSEFKPQKMLEIGVYRGQAICLWALISKHLGTFAEIHGISPFRGAGDSVSEYLQNLDYKKDVIESFAYWNLGSPILVKAFSTDSSAIVHIRKTLWDMIYIDGSHEFEIVLKDYKLCLENLRPNGILVFDDASLNTAFTPPFFSFAGHPGPSRVAREYADKDMKFICAIGHINIFQKQ